VYQFLAAENSTCTSDEHLPSGEQVDSSDTCELLQQPVARNTEVEINSIKQDSVGMDELRQYKKALGECMSESFETATGNADRETKLQDVFLAELALKSRELGVEDGELVEALIQAGKTAAKAIVLQDFEKAAHELLNSQVLKDQVIEKFVDVMQSLATSCGASEEETAAIAEKEKELLEATGEHFTLEAELELMDDVMKVASKCEQRHLNVDFFASHGATLGSKVRCGSLIKSSLSQRWEQHSKKLDAQMQTILAIHTEENNIAHHFVESLRRGGLDVGGVEHADLHRKIKNTALGNMSDATLSRLRHVEDQSFESLRGMSKREYCEEHESFSLKKPDHWISQRDEINAYVRCICVEKKVALACEAEHSTGLKKVHEELAYSLREASNASAAAIGNFGPCSPPLVCKLCVAGNTCVSTDTKDNGKGGKSQKKSVDVFRYVAKLFHSPVEIPCFSGSCSYATGVPSGECQFSFQFELGAKLSKCSSAFELMSSFHLYVAAHLCLDGPFADVASALGWDICAKIAQISYYPFIGKVDAEMDLIAFIPLVRARLTASVPVHDLTPAVELHIKTRSLNTNKDRWYSQTARVDCEGAGYVARCSGNEQHYTKQVFLRERGARDVHLYVDVGFSLFGVDLWGTVHDVKLSESAITYEWADGAPGTDFGTRKDAKCLDYNYRDGNVYMHSCNGNNNQKFFFDGEKIKTRWDDNKCLDYDLRNSNVYMGACHGHNNQRWYFNDESFRSRHDDRCLDYNWGNNNVYMHDCHGGDNQKWTFRGRNLRTRHDSKCVDYDPGSSNIYMHSCHTWGNQKFYFVGEQIKTEYDGKCMDYDPGSKNVYMGACHELTNQKWYFKGDRLVSRHDDMCLDYHTEKNNVYVHNCHAGDNQQWFFE